MIESREGPGPISFSCTASRRSKKGSHVWWAQHTPCPHGLRCCPQPLKHPLGKQALPLRSLLLPQSSWKKILRSRKRILPTCPKSTAHVMNINTEGLVEKITRVPSSDTGSQPCRGSSGDQWTRGAGVWLRGDGGSPGRQQGVIWGRGLCKGEDL